MNLLKKQFPDTPEKHRVLIFDWDVHHGNGTEEIFYKNENVLYISTHLYGDKRFYPYTGGISSLGVTPGVGCNINIPLPCPNVGDTAFLRLLTALVLPAACEYKPALVLVSAGFDIMEGDFVGRCMVTPRGLYEMTRILINGVPSAQDRFLLVLEGGYALNVLPQGVCACIQGLLNAEYVPMDELVQRESERENKKCGSGSGSGSGSVSIGEKGEERELGGGTKGKEGQGEKRAEGEEGEKEEGEGLFVHVNPAKQREIEEKIEVLVGQVKAVHAPYWKCFQS